MDELGLRLERKDFATNRYAVDEERHPKIVLKAIGRKGKVMVGASQREKEEEEEKEEEKHHASGESSKGANDDNPVNLSDHNNDASASRSQPPLTRALLTSVVVNAQGLVWGKNVMTPKSLFIEEPVIERAEIPSSRPAVETKMAKKARKSCDGFVGEVSFSAASEAS